MDAGRLRWSIVFVLDALLFCLDITAMLLVPTLLLHLRLFQSFSQNSVALREFLQSSSEPTILCRSTTVHHTIEVSSRVSKSEHICIHLPDHSLKNAQMSHTCWFYFFRLCKCLLCICPNPFSAVQDNSILNLWLSVTHWPSVFSIVELPQTRVTKTKTNTKTKMLGAIFDLGT